MGKSEIDYKLQFSKYFIKNKIGKIKEDIKKFYLLFCAIKERIADRNVKVVYNKLLNTLIK